MMRLNIRLALFSAPVLAIMEVVHFLKGIQ